MSWETKRERQEDIMTNLNDFGQDYNDTSKLDDARFVSNPIEQFTIWFDQALAAGELETNAMCLATGNAKGYISTRIVLLKYFDDNGFVFFTNYNSPKVLALKENPRGSLLFWWQKSHRQVKIDGCMKFLDAKHSDLYFARRPRASQISAWASQQSSKIESRNVLEQRCVAFEKKFDQVENIPRPENWGGIIIVPDLFEFWQGAANRLHDRISYELKTGKWVKYCLAP